MKSWILLTLLAVALTAVVTVAMPYIATDTSPRGPEFPALPPPDGPAPKLVIDQGTKYDFKVLGQEYKGEHQWTFTNEGKGVLEVRGSTVSCSCMSSDFFEGPEKKTGKLVKIQPGESKVITVNFDTKKWTNYNQYVTLATNDPDLPTLNLTITGVVKPAIVTMPPDPSVSFASVGNEEPAHRRLMLGSPDHPEIKITKIISSNPDLIVGESQELTPEEAKNFKLDKGYWINITLKPSPNLGDFNEEIVVETDHPSQKTVSVKAKGKIVGPISLIPDKVEMFNATSSNGGSQVLTIWARGRASVNFVVEKKPEGMEVSIEPQPANPDVKGSSYKMTVKLAPGLESGRVEGEIFLKTDDPKATEIHVPVNVLIKGAR
jgi:hypothetical protein